MIGWYDSSVFFYSTVFFSIFFPPLVVFIKETSVMSYSLYHSQDFADCTTVMSGNALLVNWSLDLEFELALDLTFFCPLNRAPFDKSSES